MVTGPPVAGKSTVARVLAKKVSRSVLIEGDAFFGFLGRGVIEPWRPESDNQNAVVMKAAATATGVGVAVLLLNRDPAGPMRKAREALSKRLARREAPAA